MSDHSRYLPFESSKPGNGNVLRVRIDNGLYRKGCVAVLFRSKRNDLLLAEGDIGLQLCYGVNNANNLRIYTRHFCQHETITIPELGATPFCSHHLGLLYARGCNSSSVKSYIDDLEEGILERQEVMEAVHSVLERSKEELWCQSQIAEPIYESTADNERSTVRLEISDGTANTSTINYINKEFAIIDMAIRRIEKRLARYQT